MALFIDWEIDIPEELRRLEEHKRNKETYEIRRKILRWLSSNDFEETHEGHFKERLGNTSQWLLEDPRFRNWRDEQQSSLLWCHGARKSHSQGYIHAPMLTYIL